MPNRTREKLIDVARHLFARKGIENTTMVDIANASDKGRRTIYTYFKNKDAIYEAVVERESERIVERMREVYALDLNPVEKLRQFIIIRFEILRMESENSGVNGSFRSFFNRENRRFEVVLDMALTKERKMFNDILRQCMSVPDIDTRQLARLKVVMPLLQQGIDISFMRNNYTLLGVDEESFAEVVATFVINGIYKKANLSL